MSKDAYKLTVRNIYYIILIITLSVFGCGKKNANTNSLRKVEITITGLDGNGMAEKNISADLLQLGGIKNVSFNYLNNQVMVLYDTLLITETNIIKTIQKTDDGRYKVLEVKENKETLPQTKPVIPDPKEDIHDDISDEYKDNV